MRADIVDAGDVNLKATIQQIGDAVPADVLDQLVEAAMRVGARHLMEALDAEGRIEPCGQGCGWEGPWSIETTLWPADRERLLGDEYQVPAQVAEAEERRLLRPRAGNGHTE